MMWKLVLAILAAGAFVTANAQIKTFPFAYTQQDLPNGLRLVTIPTDSPNLVSIYIVVQTGSRNEVEPGKSGFAHLFEHMMFRGTKRYPADVRQKLEAKLGVHSNAFTSDDIPVYHMTGPLTALDQVIDLEGDRFAHLTYDENAFKT